MVMTDDHVKEDNIEEVRRIPSMIYKVKLSNKCECRVCMCAMLEKNAPESIWVKATKQCQSQCQCQCQTTSGYTTVNEY